MQFSIYVEDMFKTIISMQKDKRRKSFTLSQTDKMPTTVDCDMLCIYNGIIRTCTKKKKAIYNTTSKKL